MTGAQSDQGLILRNTDGHFLANGWESTSATSQLFITLPEGLGLAGTFVVKVTNFDPYNQNINQKQPIIDLYSQPCGNKEIYETDGAWFHLISGTGYQTGTEGEAGFKLWAAPRGVGSKVEERVMNDARWDRQRTYEFKFIWSGTTLHFLVDGIERMRLPYAGQVEDPSAISFWGRTISSTAIRPSRARSFSICVSMGQSEEAAPPHVVDVQALARDKVQILFDRPVSAESAAQSANYTITPGVTIQNAALQSSNRTVWLTTTAHQEKWPIPCESAVSQTGQIRPIC